MWVSCPRSEANKSFAWGHMSKCARRGSVAHESRTPYSELGSLRFLRTWKLGRAGFMGLTRVKARVHSILLKSMKINAKRQNKDALSYSRRPETPRPARTSVFRSGHFHIAGAILGIIQRITRCISITCRVSKLFISSVSRALLLLEFAGEAWHGRRTGSPVILVLVTGPARALSQHLRVIHREGLDNFEREITTYL
jgi:hypothetical protein